jgi:maltooligosyltrehalose trehalohydrolase
MTVLFLLGPGTPLLFQGQEFTADAPFLFFADHDEELAPQVANGRRQFLSQFPSVDSLDSGFLAAPHERDAFERCKLDFADRERNAPAYALHKDLLRLRREDATLASANSDGFILTDHAFALRYFSPNGDDRLLLLNLGADFEPRSIADPLIAPPEDRDWRLLLSSEDARYGGSGAYDPCTGGWWRISGHAAVLMAAKPR